MGIIGYDGRLRPAGRALDVSAPNGFDVGAVEKIGNAQPKFVEETMKLVNSLAGNASKYGNTLAGIAEEEDHIKWEEQFAAERRRVEDEVRKIREDDTLSPDEKVKRVEAVNSTFKAPTTGRERFDAKLASRGKDFVHSQLMSIYSVAESERDSARKAQLDAAMAVDEITVKNDFTGNLPVFLTGITDINQIPEEIDKYLSDKFGAEAYKNPENKLDVDRFKNGIKAALIGMAGGAFTQNIRAEKKANAEMLITGASSGAVDVSGAMSVAERVVNDNTYASVFPTDGAKARTVVATAISFSENKYNSVTQAVGTDSDAKIKNASEFLNAGDKDGYDNAVREANAYVEGQYNGLITSLRADKKAVIEKINSNEKLGEEDKEAQCGIATKKYDDLIRKAKDKKVADTTKLRSTLSSKKKEAGENAFTGMQKMARGESHTPTELEVRLAAKIQPSKEYIAEYNAKNKYNPKVKERFFDLKFNGVKEDVATEATIASLQYEIAGIDLSSKNEQNIFEIERILDLTAQLFPYGGIEWQRVANFAWRNIGKERNPYGSKVNDWVSRNFYKGKSKEDWLKSASDNEISRKDHFVMLLSEFQGSEAEFEKYAKDLSSMVVFNNVVDVGFGGIPNLESGILRARQTEHSPDNTANNGKPSGEQPTYIEHILDTYSDDPLAAGQAIIAHRQKPKWEQDFAEYEYKAELAGDKAELDALKRGRSVKQAEAERAAAVNGFWIDSGREFGVYYHGRREHYGMQGKQAVIDGLKKRAEQEEKDKKERAKYDKERAPLLRALKEAGLPLSRREYNTFLGIGGYSVNDSDELELSGLVREDRELSNSEIREVLKQFGEIRKKEELARPEREAAEKRIAELEAKMK